MFITRRWNGVSKEKNMYIRKYLWNISFFFFKDFTASYLYTKYFKTSFLNFWFCSTEKQKCSLVPLLITSLAVFLSVMPIEWSVRNCTHLVNLTTKINTLYLTYTLYYLMLHKRILNFCPSQQLELLKQLNQYRSAFPPRCTEHQSSPVVSNISAHQPSCPIPS